MLSNLHTHSSFCDGSNLPEEIVLAAIERGFSSIGFSGHGYTHFDLRYCMKNTEGYISEITRLQEKYRDKIQIYLGVEEDAFSLVDRAKFDYIIGSSHYFHKNDKYLPIDSSYDYFKKCLEEFNYDTLSLATSYYSSFCNYIKSRKPDIIGHFDLITKFDELDTSLFLKDEKYNRIAEGFILEAMSAGCIFEINTGAISRGYRTRPYPSENLLHTLKKSDSRITLSSDCHSADSLDFAFGETKKYLFDVGFRELYVLFDGHFIKEKIM
jgi:histidinol-phosphatase (PHP family)